MKTKEELAHERLRSTRLDAIAEQTLGLSQNLAVAFETKDMSAETYNHYNMAIHQLRIAYHQLSLAAAHQRHDESRAGK